MASQHLTYGPSCHNELCGTQIYNMRLFVSSVCLSACACLPDCLSVCRSGRHALSLKQRVRLKRDGTNLNVSRAFRVNRKSTHSYHSCRLSTLSDSHVRTYRTAKMNVRITQFSKHAHQRCGPLISARQSGALSAVSIGGLCVSHSLGTEAGGGRGRRWRQGSKEGERRRRKGRRSSDGRRWRWLEPQHEPDSRRTRGLSCKRQNKREFRRRQL